MAKKARKYKPGETVKDMNELADQEFIYFHHKIYHTGWFGSWSFSWINTQLKRGLLKKAIKIEEETK